MKKKMTRLLQPLAALSALALTAVVQPVAAQAASAHVGAGRAPAAKSTASPSADPSSGKPNEAPAGDVPKGLEKFYKQKLAWVPCKDKPQMQCADVKVPLDYKKPGGKTIIVAMAKVPAANGKPIGSLFVNPGGPGESGIDLVSGADKIFSKALRDQYDIVGFDPRGVGSSTAVDCVSDAELAKIADTDVDLSTPEGRQTDKAITEQEAKGCQEKSGNLLPYLGTESAARDLDVLRGLVGDKKLNYFGFSYGTSLGGMYANLFPKKTGRLVLDGALDPQFGGARMGYEQTIGFEKAFERYAEYCVKGGNCPLGSSVDAAKKKMRALFDQAFKKPFPTADPKRPLNRNMLKYGVMLAMYSTAYRPYLDTGLSQLIKNNDGSFLLGWYDLASGRQGGKFKNNSNEARTAINCADYPASSPSVTKRYQEKLKKEAPLFGAGSGGEETDLCSLLPYHPKSNPGPYTAKGSAPIVVIGTRHDPATPYHWAQALHKSLSNSVLLTWEGDGHLAYSRAGSCIESPVDKYLLTGEVPKDGLVCPVEQKQGQEAQKQGDLDRKASVKDKLSPESQPHPVIR
mgnify:FL=1